MDGARGGEVGADRTPVGQICGTPQDHIGLSWTSDIERDRAVAYLPVGELKRDRSGALYCQMGRRAREGTDQIAHSDAVIALVGLLGIGDGKA